MQESDMKKVLAIFTIILFFGSLFSPIIFGHKIKNESKKETINNSNDPKIKNKPASKYMIFKRPTIKSQKLLLLDKENLPKKKLTSTFTDNIIITDSTDNESYPSVTNKGYSALIGYENDDISKIFLRKSEDYGQNWSNEFQIEVYYNQTQPDIDASSPDISYSNANNKVYGAYVCPKGDYGVNGFFVLPNIEDDLKDVTTYTIDWTFSGYDYSFWGFKNPSIVAYDNDTTPWIIATIGSTNYTDLDTGWGACNNSTMIMFNDLYEPFLISLVWFPDIENCKNLSVANDFYYPNIYGVCEIQKNDSSDIFFFKGYPHEWYNSLTLENKTFSLKEGNLEHPNIFTKDNHIYIVTEAVKNQSQDILLYHSFNCGENWNVYNITADIIPSEAIPKYPSIYANKNKLSCMFTESGNLFFTNSTDFGKTWANPIKLNNPNGTVAEGYRDSQMPSLNHFVWTDDREENNNIYGTLKTVPCCPTKPKISGNKYGRVGIEYEYSFVSTSSQDNNIYYYIDWGDGTSKEWIGPFDSGEKIILKHSWLLNGKYKIMAKARNDDYFESEWTNPFELIIDDINPEISIVKPIKGLYLSNRLIRNYIIRMPLVIGDLEIEVNVTDFGSGIEKVEFYDGLLGNRLIGIDTTYPYSHNWIGERPRLIHICLIRAIAYDNVGLQDEAHIMVRKLL